MKVGTFGKKQRLPKYVKQMGIGLALLVCIFFAFLVAILGISATQENTTETRQAMVVKWRVQLESVSQPAFSSLGNASKGIAQKIGLAAQAEFNKTNGKGGTISIDEMDQKFRATFPMYFPLELRGTSLDPIFEGDNRAWDYGFWRYIMGHSTVIVQYDGLRPASAVGLPDDTTGKRLNMVAQFTLTAPFDLEVHRTEVPEDGNGTDLLGSVWRPAIPVSTWTGTKNKTSTGTFPPNSSLYTTIPRYDSTGQMKFYVAFAVPGDNPPIDLTPGTLTQNCPDNRAQDTCIAVDEDGNCNLYGVQDTCTGAAYNVHCSDPAACAAIASDINTNRSGLSQTIHNLELRVMVLPVSNNWKTGQEPIGAGVYSPPRDNIFGKLVPPGLDGTLPAPPPGGTTKTIKQIPAGLNFHDAQIKFSHFVMLAPGKYIVDK